MKRFFILVIAICCSTITHAQKKDKKAKKDSVQAKVPKIVKDEEINVTDRYDDVKVVEAVKEEGDYGVVEAPVMVEEAPRSYYGNSNRKTKADTVKSMLDVNGKYNLVTISGGSNYYSKYGVEDANGKTVLPVVYSSITKCDDGYILKLGSNSSLVDFDFSTIFPMEYFGIEPIKDRGLYLLRKRNGATRIVNKAGIDQLQVSLRNAGPLTYRYSTLNNKSDFLQLENMEGKKAVYDLNKKKLVIGFVAKNIAAYENGIIVTDDTSSRILNSKDLSPLLNESFSYINPPRNMGGFIVNKNGKVGLISVAGKYLLPCDYNNILPIESGGIGTIYIANRNNKYTCFDYLGKNLLNESYDLIRSIYRSSSSQLLVKSGKKFGIKDYLNHTLVPIEFDTIYNAEYGNTYAARKGNKITIYSNQGTVINELEFERLEPVNSSGTFTYQKNNKWGLVASNFEMLTEAIYEKIEPYSAYNGYSYGDSYFKATKSGKMGLISRRGDVMLPFIYDLIDQLDDYAILLKQNGKYGLTRTNTFKSMAACEYDAIGNQYEGYGSSYSSKSKYVGIKNGEAISIVY